MEFRCGICGTGYDLISGCICEDKNFRKVSAYSVRVLNRSGYDLMVPRSQHNYLNYPIDIYKDQDIINTWTS